MARHCTQAADYLENVGSSVASLNSASLTAITANGSTAGTGQWQYLSGVTWLNIGAASNASAMLLSNGTQIRFNPALDEFVAEAATVDAIGGRGLFVSGAFLGGAFAYGWRLERCAILDVGPHR